MKSERKKKLNKINLQHGAQISGNDFEPVAGIKIKRKLMHPNGRSYASENWINFLGLNKGKVIRN